MTPSIRSRRPRPAALHRRRRRDEELWRQLVVIEGATAGANDVHCVSPSSLATLLPPSTELSHEHPASTWVAGLVHPSGVVPVEYETMSRPLSTEGSLPTTSIVRYAAPCGVTSAYACPGGDEQNHRDTPVL